MLFKAYLTWLNYSGDGFKIIFKLALFALYLSNWHTIKCNVVCNVQFITQNKMTFVCETITHTGFSNEHVGCVFLCYCFNNVVDKKKEGKYGGVGSLRGIAYIRQLLSRDGA